MSPQEFLEFNNSTSTFEYLTVFPKDMTGDLKLSNDALVFLAQTGIPTYAAPHLYFGEFDDGQFLPLLKDWSWRKQAYENEPKAWVIGCAPDESPVCIMENGQIFIYRTSRDRQLLNNSLPQLIGALVVYAIMVDKTVSERGDDAFMTNDIPEHLIDEFEKELLVVDGDCCMTSSFWSNELHRLRKQSKPMEN